MAMYPLNNQGVLELLKKHEANESYYYPSHDEIDKIRSFISTLSYDRSEINGIQIITNDNNIYSNLGLSRVRTRYHNSQQDMWYNKIKEKIPMMYYYLLFDTVRSFMKESIDEKYLEVEANINIEYLISYQTNAILGILIEWHRQGYKTSIQELNQQLIAITSINRKL